MEKFNIYDIFIRNLRRFLIKEIIINPSNIIDNEITDRKEINNYIFKYNNKILLKKHHNSYYFIHDEDLNMSYKKELFVIKNEYDEDYPFVGDKCLTKKYFYLIEGDVNIENTEWIELNELIQKLDAQRYNNPRVQSITDEIIEIISYLTN